MNILFKNLDRLFYEIEVYANGDKTELTKKQMKGLITYRINRCLSYKADKVYIALLFKYRKMLSSGKSNTPKSELSSKTIELVGFNSGRAKRWVKRLLVNPNDEKALKKLKTIKSY